LKRASNSFILRIYPPKFKVTPNYSAGLLLIDTYYKIMQKSQQAKNKGSGERVVKQKESCWTKLARLCGDSEVTTYHSLTPLTHSTLGIR